MKARRTATSEKRMLGAGEEHARSLDTHLQAVYNHIYSTCDVMPHSFAKALIIQTYSVHIDYVQHIEDVEQFYMGHSELPRSK